MYRRLEIFIAQMRVMTHRVHRGIVPDNGDAENFVIKFRGFSP